MSVYGFRFYFTPLAGVLFAFPSRYFSAIGSCLVFSLGSWSTRIPAGFPVPRRTQDSARVRPVSDTRLSRATARLSMRFSYLSVFTNSCRSPTTPLKAVWAFPRSLAATWGISFDFFSSGYLDVSVPRVPSPFGVTVHDHRRVAPFGDPWIYACLRLPMAFRSLLRPSSAVGA